MTKKDKKDDFEIWARGLDEKFEKWSWSLALDKDDRRVRTNVWELDQTLSLLKGRCAAPFCGYPIPEIGNFQIYGVGNVCNLCWAMYCMAKISAQRVIDEEKKKRGLGL